MKHERATEEIREQAALYALGSLTQHEARSFEIHLQEGCSICKSEFRKFERVVAELGFAAEEADTPDYLRDLLLARAEREPQTSVPAAVPAQKSEAAPPKGKPPVAPPAKAAPPKSGSGASVVVAWFFAVAFIILAVLAYFYWKFAEETNFQLQTSVAVERADAENLRKLLENQNAKARDLEQILAAVEKPGVLHARLAGQEVAPSSSGVILWDTEQKRCLLFGSFPPAPAGKTYQLWFVTPAARVPVGLVKNESSGRVFTALSIPVDASDAAAVLVTLEPDNGSQIPTSPFYAIGRFD